MKKLSIICTLTTGLLASSQAITWTMQSVTVPGTSNALKISAFNSQGTMAIRESSTGKIFRRLRNGQTTQFVSDITIGEAEGINEFGDIVVAGANNTTNPSTPYIKMWNANGSIEDWSYPIPPGTGASLSLQGLNESRQAVGYGVRFSPDMYGACASYSPTSSMVLTELGGSFAKDISNDGTIVGMNEYRPGTWDLAGNYTALPLPVGDTSGAAHVITESGYIAGYTKSGSQFYMTIWSKSTRQVLYHIPAVVSNAINAYFVFGLSMNENRDVVYQGANGYKFWSAGTGVVDFKTSISNPVAGMINNYGLKINDNREIVGGYRLGSTTYYNTLYTPVPEPSEFAVMGVGIVGLLLARRRTKRIR